MQFSHSFSVTEGLTKASDSVEDNSATRMALRQQQPQVLHQHWLLGQGLQAMALEPALR